MTLYGSLAGVVVFLVRLWVSHPTLLVGARFAVEPGRADGDRPRAREPRGRNPSAVPATVPA